MLRNSQHWSIEGVRQMLSEEGLTAVVLPRWHIKQSIKRASVMSRKKLMYI